MDLPRTPDPGGEPELSGWLAEVEGRLAAIDARLAHLETSLRPAVAEEVQGATADLRRALTELGRRLVTDLPHELARHRDAIVAELRPPPPPPPAPPTPPADDDLDAEPDLEEAPVVLAAPSATRPEPPDAPDADGRRASRRRRRHG